MKTLINNITVIIISLVALIYSIGNLTKQDYLNKLGKNGKMIISVLVIISIIVMISNCLMKTTDSQDESKTSINYGALPSDRSSVIYKLPNGKFIVVNRSAFNNFEKFIGGQNLITFIRNVGSNRMFSTLDVAKKSGSNLREANDTENDYITRFLNVITLKDWNPSSNEQPIDRQSDVPEQKKVRSYWRFYLRNDGNYEYQEPNSPGLGCCLRSRADLDNFLIERNIGDNYKLINDQYSKNNTELLNTIGDTTIRRHSNDRKVYIWYGDNVSWKDGSFSRLDEALKKLNQMSNF